MTQAFTYNNKVEAIVFTAMQLLPHPTLNLQVSMQPIDRHLHGQKADFLKTDKN